MAQMSGNGRLRYSDFVVLIRVKSLATYHVNAFESKRMPFKMVIIVTHFSPQPLFFIKTKKSNSQIGFNAFDRKAEIVKLLAFLKLVLGDIDAIGDISHFVLDKDVLDGIREDTSGVVDYLLNHTDANAQQIGRQCSEARNTIAKPNVQYTQNLHPQNKKY